MLDEFEQCYIALLAVLHTEEEEQKKRYVNTIDIKDASKADAIIIDARIKIQRIRGWVEDLQRIADEVSRVFTGASVGDVSDLIAPQPVLPSETPKPPASNASQSSPIENSPPADDTEESESKKSSRGISAGIISADAESIKGFSFLEKTYNVNNWTEFFIRVCEILILKKPYKFIGMGKDGRTNPSREPILNIAEPQTESYHKLSNGLFVNTESSAQEIKEFCAELLSACGYSGDTLIIL